MHKPALSKPLRRLLIVAAGLLVLLVLLGGPAGMLRLYRLHAEVQRLHSEVTQARATVDSLQREIVRLRSDTAYIEQVARQKLGMARPNEKVYKFVEERKK